MDKNEKIETKNEVKIGYRDVFSQREYVKLILSNLVNRFGDSIDAIAFTWLVYAITGSAAWSAAIFAVNQLPSVLLQPFAGALVEGMNKKRLMIITDVIRGVTTAALAVLYIRGYVNPWILVIFTLINSSVEAFCLPAGMAIIPKLLDKKYYTHGTALNSTLSTAVQLIGLGMAGIIIGAFGIGTAIFIDAVSFFGSGLVLCFLKIKEEHPGKQKLDTAAYWSLLKGGMDYLKERPVICNFCMMGIVINAAIVPLNSLQSPLVYEVMGQGSELLSVLSVALMAGMGIGSFWFPFISNKVSVRTVIVTGGLAIGSGMYLYTWGTWLRPYFVAIYILSIFVSFLIGFSVSLISAVLQVQFVSGVEQEYLARVGSIFNACACAATPVASIAVSGAASVWNVSQVFIVSAVLCVVLFLYIAIRKVRFE